jgi:Ran GTPase-activating protein (RanGAP) involved in mRNA processing and transport/predicted esterase
MNIQHALDRLETHDSPVARQAARLFAEASGEDRDRVNHATNALLELLRDPSSRGIRKPLKRLAHRARRQRRVLDRFGRDPHRNAELKRESTPAETTFLMSQEALQIRPRAARRLRVLVLHGMRQSARRLRERLRTLDRALDDVVEFVYLDGPYAVDDAVPHQRCWWKTSDDNRAYAGWEASVRQIDAHLPADGVLGFSQGAALTGLYAALRTDALRFVICVAGFPSRADAHQVLLEPDSIALPSFHLWGERDTMVEPARSRALAEVFVGPTLQSHAGGHFAPDHLPVDALRVFLTAFLDAPPAPLQLDDPSWSADLSLADVKQRLPAGPALAALLAEVRRAYPTSAQRDPYIDSDDGLAHRVWMAAFQADPARFAAAVHDETDFRALTWLTVRAAQQLEDAAPLVDLVANRFVAQLQADESAGSLSPAAEAAPRTGSGLDGISGLGRRIAQIMAPDKPHPAAYADYRRRIVAMSKRTRAFRQRAQGLPPVANPSQQVSAEVMRPRPVPVVPCPPEELTPLLSYLESNQQPWAPEPFQRGTLMPDGRLDLCKQVVGPAGIGPLLDALDGNPHVHRLLLGNNVVGPTGADRIARFIASRDSHVRVWYLAGNELDAAALEPLCDALAAAPSVEGLWLKRNPLGPAAAEPLGRLLRVHTGLQTLDLVNTGLLDVGVLTLSRALVHNQGLKHLYLGTNGLGVSSATSLAVVLRECALESLYVDCNRLGDEGVRALAAGLAQNTSLRRLSLASNRIGPSGMAGLAEAIVDHPSLQFLNLGWTRATNAVHEAGNMLGDEGAAVLAELLRSGPKLTALDVSHNQISQDGLDLIAEAVALQPQLVELRCAQRGMSSNVDRMARLRGAVTRNLEASGLDADGVEAIRTPLPAREVLSVYRTAPLPL